MISFEEEFDLFDSFIGESQDPIVIVGAVDPNDAVLGLETESQVLDELMADPKVPGDTFDGGAVMHLIRVHDQAVENGALRGIGFVGSIKPTSQRPDQEPCRQRKASTDEQLNKHTIIQT